MAKTKDQSAQPTDIDPASPAPKGASVAGLKDSDEIEVVHPKTNQTYGVSVKAYKDLYEPAGFVPTRMGNGELLPDDPRKPADVPEDVPPVVVSPEAETGADPEGES